MQPTTLWRCVPMLALVQYLAWTKRVCQVAADFCLVRRMRASRVIPVFAFLIGVLLIGQGLCGIIAPDVFVGVVRFFQTPSCRLRRSSVAHRYRHCARSGRERRSAPSHFSARLWRSHCHRRRVYAVCRCPVCIHHSCFVGLARPWLGAALCGSFFSPWSFSTVYQQPHSPRLTRRWELTATRACLHFR